MTKKRSVRRVSAMDRLLSEGFFQSKEEALPYFMRGAVFCGVERVQTGGQRIASHLPMVVKGLQERYVGKGGYKLEGALEDFHVEVSGKVCIDAGACTGGFTDCLVQHGAEMVFAVEAGFGQLAGSLQQNPRVENLERTNLGDPKLLTLNPVPVLGSVDLSYLSLVKAVPQFRAVMRNQGELICLVKPLFEIEDSQARRTGTIETKEYAPLLVHLSETLSLQEKTTVCGVTHSHITGNHGTREFFLHIRFGDEWEKRDLSAEIQQSVHSALALAMYEKA